MSRKIAIGIVIYNPEEELKTKINIAIEQGLMVYIFDNTPDKSMIRDHCKQNTFQKIKYTTVGKNVGLGYGISAITASAYYDGHEALLFFDQDTRYTKETLSFINNYYIENSKITKEYTAIVFKSRNGEADANVKNLKLQDVYFAISSGSLFFLENLKKIDWHNVRYFVDCVDYEFSFRSRNKGFRLGELTQTPGFDHVSGQPDREYQFFGRTFLIRKYSRKRIQDTLFASLRLVFSTIWERNFKYTYLVSKSLVIYVFFQAIARIIIKKNE